MADTDAPAPSLPGCVGPMGWGCFAVPLFVLIVSFGGYVIVAYRPTPAPAPAPVTCVCLAAPAQDETP